MISENERQIILLRGLPGAGKTTMAKWLVANMTRTREMVHVEGDQWRGYGDSRTYSDEFNHNAHAYCIGRVGHLMLHFQSDIVVSNTFPTLASIKPYFDMARDLNSRPNRSDRFVVTVMHVQGPLGRSVHAPAGKAVNSRRNIKGYLDQGQEYTGEFTV